MGCALPAGVAVQATGGGQPDRILYGSLGLTPGWLERGLTAAEQRWVSACLYARTNFYGLKLPVSLRAEHPDVPALHTTEEERQNPWLHEGGFFGNFFKPQPSAYVCTPDVPLRSDWTTRRVCTLPASVDAAGRRVSACGFVIRGACSDPATFDSHDGRYTEIIHVYLEPQTPAAETSPR